MIQTTAFALISGLIGALLAAHLSFVVRLKAKQREDAEERKRNAKVPKKAAAEAGQTNLDIVAAATDLSRARD